MFLLLRRLLPLATLFVLSVGVIGAATWRLARPPKPPPATVSAALERVAPLGLFIAPERPGADLDAGLWLTVERRSDRELDRLQRCDAPDWEGAVKLGPVRPHAEADVTAGKARVIVGALEVYGDPDLVRRVQRSLTR